MFKRVQHFNFPQSTKVKEDTVIYSDYLNEKYKDFSKENILVKEILEGEPVYLNVYHISKGNKYLEFLSLGVYHTTIETYSYEFAYGENDIPGLTGITRSHIDSPKDSIFCFKESHYLGNTVLKLYDLLDLIRKLGYIWTGISYCPFFKNCNNFTESLSKTILFNEIKYPTYINRFKYLGCCFVSFFKPLQRLASRRYAEMKSIKTKLQHNRNNQTQMINININNNFNVIKIDNAKELKKEENEVISREIKPHIKYPSLDNRKQEQFNNKLTLKENSSTEFIKRNSISQSVSTSKNIILSQNSDIPNYNQTQSIARELNELIQVFDKYILNMYNSIITPNSKKNISLPSSLIKSNNSILDNNSKFKLNQEEKVKNNIIENLSNLYKLNTYNNCEINQVKRNSPVLSKLTEIILEIKRTKGKLISTVDSLNILTETNINNKTNHVLSYIEITDFYQILLTLILEINDTIRIEDIINSKKISDTFYNIFNEFIKTLNKHISRIPFKLSVVVKQKELSFKIEQLLSNRNSNANSLKMLNLIVNKNNNLELE